MNLIQNFSIPRDQTAQWKTRQLRAGMKLVGIAAQMLIGNEINAKLTLIALKQNSTRSLKKL